MNKDGIEPSMRTSSDLQSDALPLMLLVHLDIETQFISISKHKRERNRTFIKSFGDFCVTITLLFSIIIIKNGFEPLISESKSEVLPITLLDI